MAPGWKFIAYKWENDTKQLSPDGGTPKTASPIQTVLPSHDSR